VFGLRSDPERRHRQRARDRLVVEPSEWLVLAAEREIDYQDRFPPVPPTDLAALPEVGKVRLVWRFSPSPDTVGYKIYRQDPGGEWRQLATLIAAGLEYLDTGLSSGIVFHYRVTAIDGVGNESGPSAEVETRVP